MSFFQRLISWLTGLFAGRAARQALNAGMHQVNQANQQNAQWQNPQAGAQPQQQQQQQWGQQQPPQQQQQAWGQPPQQQQAPQQAPWGQAAAAPAASKDEAWNLRAQQERNTTDVAPEQWRDDWGPVRNDQLDEFFFHHFEIEDAGADHDKQMELAKQYGYQDFWHYKRVETTFLKYYGTRYGGHGYVNEAVWQDPRVQQAMLNGRNRQTQAKQQATAAANPEMMAPVEGVTLEQYAAVSAQQARGLQQAEFQAVLAQNGCDMAKWERASGEWLARMSRDTTGTIAGVYSKAFAGAGSGAYGGAGQQAASTMGTVGQAPAGGEPMSLERYAEVCAAQGAWSQQGKDVNAMLKQVFNMSALDYSNVAAYWSQRMMSDYTLLQRQMEFQQRYESKYKSADADADLKF